MKRLCPPGLDLRLATLRPRQKELLELAVPNRLLELAPLIVDERLLEASVVLFLQIQGVQVLPLNQ